MKSDSNAAAFEVSDISILASLDPFLLDKASVNLCDTGKDTIRFK